MPSFEVGVSRTPISSSNLRRKGSVRTLTCSSPPLSTPALHITRRSATVAVATAAITAFKPSFCFMNSSAITSAVSRDVSVAAGMSASSSAVAGSPANLDLLVVGPGVLGSVLAKDWLATVPGATATGLTNTDKSHDRLQAMGLIPATRATLPPNRKWSFVLFSAPPSGSADYAADVRAATELWDGTGSFLFTSSMSVCAVDDGSQVDEQLCPTLPLGAGASTDRLLGAEQAALQAGGNVLRLVGLYHATRGAHTYFMKVGTVTRPGGYVVNLLHYEDAASLGAAILRGDGSGPFRSRVFLGSDGHPVTFEDMMESCFSSGVFPRVPINFTGTFPEDGTSGRGKRVTNTATREALGGWKPRYDSFAAFMEAGGKDFYNSSGVQF